MVSTRSERLGVRFLFRLLIMESEDLYGFFAIALPPFLLLSSSGLLIYIRASQGVVYRLHGKRLAG